MFRTVPLSIIRSFSLYTQQWYMSCSLRAGSGLSVLILLAGCEQTYNDIYHCCVYSEKTPDDGQRNCPKRVELYSKNKLEKLVHLVGFIIRIYHNARSPERQINKILLCLKANVYVLLSFSYVIWLHAIFTTLNLISSLCLCTVAFSWYENCV